MTTLSEVQARIAAISARAAERRAREDPPALPPMPSELSTRELARRQQCEATSLAKTHGEQLQCPARGHDMIDGHALCWTHGRVVLDGVAPLLDVLAGFRARQD